MSEALLIAPLGHKKSSQDSWADACYEVVAEAESDILSRLLGYFAQRNLVPLKLEAQQQNNVLYVKILQMGLSPHQAQVIAEKMRSLVSVLTVTLICKEH